MLEIRRCTLDDVATLQTLNDEVFVDNSKYDDDLDLDWARSETGRKYFSELVANPNSFCSIAWDDAKAAGYLAAGPKHISGRKSRYFEIENMGVSPEYRSKGIGKLLMDECVAWAKEKGFEKMFVNAFFANSKAINFYKNNGFAEIDISLEKRI